MDMAASTYLGLLIVLSILLNCIQLGHAYGFGIDASEMVCQGKFLVLKECADNGLLDIYSITVFSSPYSDDFPSNDSCPTNCKRKITNDVDAGLSYEYRFLYEWVMSKCQGRRLCEQGQLPIWSELIGIYHNDGVNETICLEDKQKFFGGIWIDAICRGEEFVPTWAVPSSTTTLPPIGETVRSIQPGEFGIYLHSLSTIERIILGVAIGVSLSTLILAMILIYSCERFKLRKRLYRMLSMVGRPTAAASNDWYLNELAHESEKVDGLDTDECMRPDEIVTLDRRSLKESRQIISEDSLSIHSQNSCSTGGRRSPQGHSNLAFTTSTGSATLAVPQIIVTRPCASYDSADNLDLEQRMAAVLGFKPLNETHASNTTDSSGDETGHYNSTQTEPHKVDSSSAPGDTASQNHPPSTEPSIGSNNQPVTMLPNLEINDRIAKQGNDASSQHDMGSDHDGNTNNGPLPVLDTDNQTIEEEKITPQHRVHTQTSPYQLNKPIIRSQNKEPYVIQYDKRQQDFGISDTSGNNSDTADPAKGDCEELNEIISMSKSEADRMPAVVTSQRSHSPHKWRVEVKFSNSDMHGKDVDVVGSLEARASRSPSPHRIQPTYYKCEVMDSEDMMIDIA